MNIKIFKNSNDIVVFTLNDDCEKEFNYDSFDYLISCVFENDDEISFDYDEELDEYKQLLNGIITESRKDDFRKAVANAKESKHELDETIEIVTQQ